MEWWKELAASQAVVMHVPTGFVGRAKTFWDGETNVFISPENNRAVRAPVLELEGGSSYLAKEQEDWVVLNPAAARMFVALTAGIAELTKISARNAAAQGVPMETGIAIMVSLLRTQAAALEKR